MSSIESHLSNKPKQVFFNPIHIFDTFTHSITLLYIFNKFFSFNVNFFNITDITEILNILNVECSVSNLPLLTSIDIGSSQDGSKINGSDNDLQLDDDRMELTSAGSDTGSQSMSTNNNKSNNNKNNNNKNKNNDNDNESGM